MTASPLSVGTDYETLANRFRPLFRKIAAGCWLLVHRARRSRKIFVWKHNLFPRPLRGSCCFVPSGCRWILICGVA